MSTIEYTHATPDLTPWTHPDPSKPFPDVKYHLKDSTNSTLQCSRAVSRWTAAEQVRQLHSIMSNHGLTATEFDWHASCEWNLYRNMYWGDEQTKREIKADKVWSSSKTIKKFNTEYYLDVHLDSSPMVEDILKSFDKVCTADDCLIFDSCHPPVLKRTQLESINREVCDEDELKIAKQQCSRRVDSCFPAIPHLTLTPWQKAAALQVRSEVMWKICKRLDSCEAFASDRATRMSEIVLQGEGNLQSSLLGVMCLLVISGLFLFFQINYRITLRNQEREEMERLNKNKSDVTHPDFLAHQSEELRSRVFRTVSKSVEMPMARSTSVDDEDEQEKNK